MQKQFKKQEICGEKEEKITEKESQASFVQKHKLREVECYLCGNPGHILPDYSEAASAPKDKWGFKKATQHLCGETQKSELQSENQNIQSTKD